MKVHYGIVLKSEKNENPNSTNRRLVESIMAQMYNEIVI